MGDAEKSRGYVLGVAAYLALGIALLAAAEIAFVMHSGEITPVAYVVEMQQRDVHSDGIGLLYGPALQPDNFQYKLALLKRRKPAIVSIGSSRVLAFRQQFFTKPFANLGGVMNNPLEGSLFVEDLLKVHRPSIAIINSDFWWFDSAYPYATEFPNRGLDGTRLRGEDYAVLAGWLLTGRFSVTDIVGTLFNSFASSRGFPPGIGIRAKFAGEGFGADGAEFDFGLARGSRPAWDRNFAQALGRIREGRAEYAYATGFSERAWADFLNVIDRLSAAGVRPIVFVPPIAGQVNNALAEHGERFAHLAEMKRRVGQLNVPVHDFSDLGELGGSDCEFIDAVHVGDVGGLRMVLGMASASGSPLADAVDPAWARRTIGENSGAAMLRADFAAGADVETDFLNLGCHKE